MMKQAYSRIHVRNTFKVLFFVSMIFSCSLWCTPELIHAVQQGDEVSVELALEQGADPNIFVDDKQTVLHEAVRHGHARIAALLLAHGADYTLENAQGHQPLSQKYISVDLLHAIRQQYQRLPLAPYKDAVPASEDVAYYVEQLRTHGFVKVSGLLSSDELQQLRADFAEFIANIERKRTEGTGIYTHYDNEEYWRKKDNIYVTNNACKYSPQLVKFCCHPTIVETANHYMQKFAYIQKVLAMRYPSGGPMGDTQFKWHHDMDEKRMKMMVLLTDVTERDQYMTYVLGTHNIVHPFKRFLTNNLNFNYCSKHVDAITIVKTIGKAGDIFFFDPNGMHSGNRSKGAVRDVFLVEYTADKNNMWGGTLSEEILSQYLQTAHNPFERFLAVTPKWQRTRGKRRKGTTWSESLMHPELWV